MVRGTWIGSFTVIALAFVAPSIPHSRCATTKPAASISTIPAGLSTSDWSSVRAAYEASLHGAYAVDGGYQARNPGQRWLTHFDDNGFTTTPDSGGWTWGLEIESYGIAGQKRAVSKSALVKIAGQRVSRDWDSDLTEWYVNDARGLEHGYTVHKRPGTGAGPLHVTLTVRGELRPEILGAGRDIQFVASDGSSPLTYSKLSVLDADGGTVPCHFEEDADRLCFHIDDRGARYPLTIDPIAQQAYVKAVNTGALDHFGQAVAVSGNTVVIGAHDEDSSAIGVNGNPTDNSAVNSGAAYVFVRNGTTWSQQAYLKASNSGANDSFGFTVAVSGDTIVVGAWNEDSNATGVNGNQANNSASTAGAAYVFVRNGTTWSQQGYLKASNTDAGDRFGYSVAVSGETVVVGAELESSNAMGVNGNQADNSVPEAGAAYVFVRGGTTWSQQAYVKASNTGGDFFGLSVALSGDTLIVGAPFESSNATGVNGNQGDNSASTSGAAYIFVRNGTTWSQQAYLKASNTGTFDAFGFSVALSGDTAVSAAYAEDSNATGVNANQSDNSAQGSGAAYVFVRSGTTWSQQAYLKASNTGANDQFGWLISVSGNTVLVGARFEDSNAIGVNGDGGSNSTLESGAAYVFTRSGTTWSQQAYVKASNTGGNDQFGTAVAVSGDTVVAGAIGEASIATGVNANQSDNSATDSGAAYIFDLDNNPGTSSYGTGTPGCSGTQTLDVNHAPMVNSPAFAFTCNNTPPSSLGLGLVTDSQDLTGSDPFGLGVLLHVDFFAATEVLSFDFVSDPSGNGLTLGTGIPNSPFLIGKNYYAIALWAWTTCSLPPFNLSTSRGLAITIQTP